MRNITIVTLLLVAAAGGASAQASIDPGMNKDQVLEKLGKPASEHSSGTSTYLYYHNGQEQKVGMSDMVALENGKVVDAVFRSNDRAYSGKSSSPVPISREAAIAKGNGGNAPLKMPAPAKKAPDAKKAPETKKAAPPAKTAPPAKAVPPAKRPSEPLKGGDKKIAPPTKSSDTAKKATPAPAKKP